ncbi:hypothetical protein Rvan_1254 [Rhodomicrobium vannielii ATCC 17100]|uniref:Uncharacterized protein n=1 Tax=Rhodomicrobium vannielii (strain ATCC 17100 / DSM 162 / LMG 4299 / NCIMB 10020 / ATH 3.1.1) TaxID=648757 RepID=E3I568_RHOVT|nr:hypothetical protein [Rhodomicrobium vannielii]ADP70518.1 hypothetical protein Rvan_1254 [Rhodomicrobium vannielii ATCC 17100]
MSAILAFILRMFVRTFFAGVLAGILVTASTPEVRCCLGLEEHCKQCVAAAWVPAEWRAKPIVVANRCVKDLNIKVLYVDADGETRASAWNSIEARSESRLKAEDGREVVSYGGSYGYKAYLTSPPANMDYTNVNVFNELSAWRKAETRINVVSCGL